MKTILAVDPGHAKCGVAVVNHTARLHMAVVSRGEAAMAVSRLAAEYSVDEIVVGNGTGGENLAREIESVSDIPIHLVDEALSTRRARVRFFSENPPGGIRRLIPRGLLTPDRPIDDFVALILAEEFLQNCP